MRKPEMMTIVDVVELCYKNGGVFYASGEPDIKIYVNKHGIVLFKSDDTKMDISIQYFEKMWIYEPAHPKILSSMEIRNIVARKRPDGKWLSDDIDDLIEISDKNGQLKERLNHKKPMKAFVDLIDKAKRYMKDNQCNDFTVYIYQAEKEIQNLKRLDT